MYGDRAWFALYRLPLARQFIELFATDLDCAVHWRRLFDIADEAGQSALDIAALDLVGAFALEDFASGIVSCGGNAEMDLRSINLAPAHDVVAESRGRPQTNDQHAVSKRVQSAGVTHFLGASERSVMAAHLRDDVMTGLAEGFVEIEESGDGTLTHSCLPLPRRLDAPKAARYRAPAASCPRWCSRKPGCGPRHRAEAQGWRHRNRVWRGIRFRPYSSGNSLNTIETLACSTVTR